EQLIGHLSEYLDVLSRHITDSGGTVDKYIGDSIMAFWGAPFPQDDHASRSVRAAFEMHREIKILCESFIKRGWPAPSMSIGINTGMMNVGNMGSRYRVAYTDTHRW
ncbi:MAG: adenylate/guanylate cyclase domain-containing protein, partial [Gammaproteobacteria bacterium]|nr:adenylate/guanylate cyclase domain-containing protein [Gammaproteobacteria bacterium]